MAEHAWAMPYKALEVPLYGLKSATKPKARTVVDSRRTKNRTVTNVAASLHCWQVTRRRVRKRLSMRESGRNAVQFKTKRSGSGSRIQFVQ